MISKNIYIYKISVVLFLMILLGDINAWAQTGTNYSGLFYFANCGSGKSGDPKMADITNPDNYFYLVPADNPQQNDKRDAWFSSDYSTANGDPEKPYLTTYRTKKDAAAVPSGVTNRPHNSVWIVKFASTDSGKDYYNLIHAATGKYVVYEPPYSAKNNRKSMHLLTTDSPGENAKFAITLNSGNYNFRPKSIGTGASTNKYLNAAQQNYTAYYSSDGYADSPADYFRGLVGLWKDAGDGSDWQKEAILLDAPTISDVDASNKVTITDANNLPFGYEIRYTTDGSTTPTASTGTVYSGPISLTSSVTIKAVVVRYGMVLTEVASEVREPVPCATPVITYDYNTSNVSITCATAGSTIHYTTNGNTPTASSTEYYSPFSVTSPTTVKAIATHTTLIPSNVAELVISQVATPTIQNNGSNAISITTATPGATIYYTTDGSIPTTSSTEYAGPLTENVSNVTIKAIAVKENMITSEVGSGSVKLQCATPVITRIGLTFTLSCSKPTDANLYYTIGGGSEVAYAGTPVSFTANQLPMTVTAVARHSNYAPSETASFELKNGSGTPDDPYLIYGATDFATFVTNVNNGTTASACYKLGSDVSASGTTAINSFKGTFDGNGYIISDLSHPLFNTVDGGVVKNVTLMNVSISSSGNYVGAIAGTVKSYSRIYNCGILPNSADFPEGTHPTVTTTGTCAGGIVGRLEGDSRVINCYSYADVSASTRAAGIVGQNTNASNAAVTDGKYANLRTAVVNCMFYGDILGGTYQYGVYGGSLITNAAATGISSYNYYRNGTTFNTANGNPSAYNCSFPAEERYLTQVEFHRYLLNSNRELCGWWVGSDVAPNTLTTAQVQAIPKDASLMYKWVVDPNVAPYPILKPFGKYASVINGNTGTPWVDRAIANPYQGKQLGTLTVKVNSGSHSSAASQTLYIPITDMDTLRYDFGYRKIQLPYYNTVFGDPDGANWDAKYAGNYKDYVVTGWKVTNVETDGTVETYNGFVADWQDGYNFADRKCIDKDIYSSINPRVFAQGGNYYVPDGVTEITIEAYWGKAIYVRNDGNYYDRVNITLGTTGSAFAPAGTRDNNVNGATIQTTSIKNTLTDANIDAKKTVYDYALVLVGNVQESVSNSDVIHATEDTRGFTIMSVDLDFDEEPDYCLEWQLGKAMGRQMIAPIRFDFLPVVELGIAGKRHNSTNFFSLGCFRSKGHFEVTETAFIRFGQFEFELGERDEGPIILNGGIYDQYCRGRNGETNQHINYVILGGHVVMPSFTPGAHVNNSAKFQTRHCAVNALGGDFTSFYLTGGYNEAIAPYQDNPHCYIDGGRFGTIAAAYKEGIWGDVTWRINHALIDEFYGGGVMSQATGTTYKIVKGSINVVIDNSIVGKYCGGPKFGDMVSGKTVTTSATGTTFNQYFGAGNGGTNYVQYASTDATGAPISDWSGTINEKYQQGTYINTDKGYEADYDIEIINSSTGDENNKVVNRSYYYSAQFATTNTGNVTNTLNDCTINTNFYGGGFLGGVTGNVTSTLNNCTVVGSVFGAGYSASSGTVSISNTDKVPPMANIYTGMIKPQSGGTSTTYYWTNEKTFGTTTLSTSKPAIINPNNDGKNYFYTEIPLENLGTVSGNVTLTINDATTVGESVYGGGEESVVGGNTIVTVNSGSIGGKNPGRFGYRWGNVYGGGKGKIVIKDDGSSELAVSSNDDLDAGLVKGNTTVTINGTIETTKILHNVYGGGAVGSVGTFTRDANGMPTACTSGGLATVTINGGMIGFDHIDTGMVDGSSRGWEGDPQGSGSFAFLNQLAWVNNTNVTIGSDTSNEDDKGPTVYGSVYGGGENGHNFENGEVTLNKGIVGYRSGSWDCGNIYGAGCGTDTFWRDDNGNGEEDAGEEHHNPMAGVVRGVTIITINGGHVLRNVYGGGSMGSVGTYTYDGNGLPTTCESGTGKATININGGEIGLNGTDKGHVFGGPRGDLSETAFSASVRETQVNINSGADVLGSVFGGGEAGIVKESVVVNMNAGEVTQDVYGGGALANTNTNVLSGSSAETVTTTVNLKGGKVNRNVYGGALGQTEDADSGLEDVEAKVYGNVLVELNNGVENDDKGCVVLGSIFGCNNLNGTPMGDVKVHIYKTQNDAATRITNAPAGGETPAVEDAKVAGRYDVAAVYGGGNQSAYEPANPNSNKTEVIIDGCDLTSIRQVYGGGNAACTPSTNVTINGTFEVEELFGGGNGLDNILINGVEMPNPGANVGYKNYSEYYKDEEDDTWKVRDKSDADTKAKRLSSSYAYGTGKASVNLYGGTVHRVFGGSNTKGNVRLSAVTLLDENSGCTFVVDEAYGGGKSAEMDAEAQLLMACIPGLQAVYGGAEAADVRGNVTLNITNGTFDRVFGGNNLSGTIGGAITINVEEIGCRPVKIGELYGGGNQAGYSVYGYDSKGKPKETGIKLYDDPQVNVMSFTSIGQIFGGGFGDGATLVGNPTVNVNEVYGRYYDQDVSVVGEDAETPNHYPIPSHVKGKMGAITNVFGGGNAAKVIGNTNVNIATLDKVYVVKQVAVGDDVSSLFTRNNDGTYTAATGTAVDGTTYYEKKDVQGVDIRGNVYGGGNNAKVTGDSKVKIGKKDVGE